MSNSAKSTASMNYITACNHALARENRRGRSLGAARKKLSEKLCQLPSTAAHEPGETTTCALSVAYGLGATRRPSGV